MESWHTVTLSHDGARDDDVILEIVGMGPGTAIAAETR
jgi:hypothetical protein